MKGEKKRELRATYTQSERERAKKTCGHIKKYTTELRSSAARLKNIFEAKSH